MNSLSGATSEEELQQMLEDGRISQQEYEQLRTAMEEPRQRPDRPADEKEKAASKRRLGKIAFGLLLAGIALPLAGYLAVDMLARSSGSGAAIGPWFFLGLALLISAIVVGVFAWPDIFGKGAVITSAILLVLTALFMV